MAFRLEDFKKTTRKAAAGCGAPAALYPHQIKNKKAIAKMEIAIRTFDALVGRRRGDMDAQTMVDFFGDPRLARGIVACLGQFYKYQTPRFADVIASDSMQKLAAQDLHTPLALRTHTYRHVNQAHNGFLEENRRAECYTELGAPFDLAAHDWERLLYLDAEDNQILTRGGRIPTPKDIVTLYNFHALDTALRRATQITLTGLTLTSSDAADVRALARSLSLKAVVSGEGGSVTLTDLEMSSLLPRRPGRLARCLLHLIQTHVSSATQGFADVLLGARKFRLALGVDAWKTLGYAPTQPIGNGAFRRRTEIGGLLHKELLKLRAQGGLAGWRVQRRPEPAVTATGVLLLDFRLTRGDRSAYLLLGDSVSGAGDETVITLPLDRRKISATALMARVEAAAGSLFDVPATPSLPAVPSDFRTLCDRAVAQGLIRTADAQRILHLLDESPLIEWIKRAADPRVRYLPGIGLFSQELVSAIASEETHE